MSQKLWLSAAVVAAIVSWAGHASVTDAAVIITDSKNVAPSGGAVHDVHDPSAAGTPDLLTASSTDLIQGLTATVSYSGGGGSTTSESSAGEVAWTDGSLLTVYGESGSGGDAVDHAAYGTVNAPGVNTHIVYDLGGLYDISAIDVFTGWNDSGRDDISFDTLVSVDDVTYSTIASYVKGPDDTGAITDPITNLHAIADDGGAAIASAVRYVQLQVVDADNGFAGVVEIDVFGVQVPEPASAGLTLLAGLALVGFRRRG